MELKRLKKKLERSFKFYDWIKRIPSCPHEMAGMKSTINTYGVCAKGISYEAFEYKVCKFINDAIDAQLRIDGKHQPSMIVRRWPVIKYDEDTDTHYFRMRLGGFRWDSLREDLRKWHKPEGARYPTLGE